jgi:hypothetical protein
MNELAEFQFSTTLNPSCISILRASEFKYSQRNMVFIAFPNSARTRYVGCLKLFLVNLFNIASIKYNIYFYLPGL